MALVSLKNVEVVKVFATGHGLQVAEKFTAKGAERERRFTIWFEKAHGLREGDRIDVSGLLGVSVEPWQDREGKTRHAARISVNKPRFELAKDDAPAGQFAGSHEAGLEPWAADSVPF